MNGAPLDFDPYEVLGVADDADAAAIRAAFRLAARRYHPDVGGDAAQFDRAKKARDVLLDPEQRARYDESGCAAVVRAPDPDRDARNLLVSAFVECLSEYDPLQGACNLLSDRSLRQRTELDKMRARRDALQQHIARLSCTLDFDPISAELQSAVRHVEDNIATAQRKVEAFARAEALAAHWSYEAMEYRADPPADFYYTASE